jgi:hypothetical protein
MRCDAANLATAAKLYPPRRESYDGATRRSPLATTTISGSRADFWYRIPGLRSSAMINEAGFLALQLVVHSSRGDVLAEVHKAVDSLRASRWSDAKINGFLSDVASIVECEHAPLLGVDTIVSCIDECRPAET